MIDFSSLQKTFYSAPGDDLVAKTILQMQKVPQFVKLFADSWADYPRQDWPVRELPAINIFESGSEAKSSDMGYLTGSVQIQIFWPSEFRRTDLSRVPGFFKGAVENFFNSKYVSAMLDELYLIQRDEKVAGLNEYGKTLNWSPNVEGLTDGEMVPVTILDVQYRIDLRAWERALEFMGRTTANPFEKTLDDLTDALGGILGVDDNNEVKTVVAVDFPMNEGE